MPVGVFLIFMAACLMVLQARPVAWLIPFFAAAPLVGLAMDPLRGFQLGWGFMDRGIHWSVPMMAVLALIAVHERRPYFGFRQPVNRVGWLSLLYLIGGIAYALLPQPSLWIWGAKSLVSWFLIGFLPPLLVVRAYGPGNGGRGPS